MRLKIEGMSDNFSDLKRKVYDSVGRQRYVTEMFDQLAPRYDRFNRLVSFSQDEKWRLKALDLLGECGKGVVLDLAAGTGDLARSALRNGARHVQVFDISYEMLRLAKGKLAGVAENGGMVHFQRGSADQLPFSDGTLDAVASGFAMRNVFHFLDDVLAEIFRVLRPGGRFAILELSQPRNFFLRTGFALHLKTIMPLIGKMTAGASSPFSYLGNTALTFLKPEEFAQRLTAAGFSEVAWQPFMLGGICIHTGLKVK